MPDDFEASIFTQGTVGTAAPATGEIDVIGDHDWFAANLTAGHRYNIFLYGSETGVGTLFDPYFAGVYNNDGIFLGGADDDSGAGLDSFSSFVASYTGTHYFSAGAAVYDGFNTGTYVLQYSDLGPDIGIPQTPIPINEGETLFLEFTFEDFGVSRDVVYDWDVTSIVRSGTADTSDFLLTTFEDFDSLNVDLTATDDALVEDDESLIFEISGYIEYIAFGSDNEGEEYLNVDGFPVFGQIQRYQFTEILSFDINSAPEGAPPPITDFAFSAPGVIGNVLTTFADGSEESFDVIPRSFSGPLTGSILENGDIYISGVDAEPNTLVDIEFTVIDMRGAMTTSVQSIEVVGETDDYLPGPSATAFGTIDVNSTESGTIETDGDRDRFVVELQAGAVYDISLEGAPTSAGTLANPRIVGIFDSFGTFLSGSGDDDGGVGANALVDGFTVSTDGFYEVEVASASDIGIGDYSLTVSVVDYLDDFLPGVSDGFGTVALGSPATGEIELPGDIDGFQVTLEAGTTYQINLLGQDSGGGSLSDPYLRGVFGPGATEPFSLTADDDSGIGFDSLANFTPSSSGDYFIEVTGFDGTTGSYTLTVDDLGLVDDFAADPTTTGTVAVNGDATGQINFPDDEDWFAVTLNAGQLYRIELVPDDENALLDPVFNGVYDANGILIPNTGNDDGGDGTGSILEFSPDQSGLYYLSAGGFSEETGQYRLILSDLGGVVDDGDFDITLDFQGPEEYRAAFEAAIARWETVITGDLPFASVEGYGFVDDILIEVNISDIDLVYEGVEQTIIAISSVLDQRDPEAEIGASLPTHSRIVVNSDEADRVIRNLDDLAANAIGRALGFGILWEDFGLVTNLDGTPTYTGGNALRELAALGGSLNGVNALEDGADGALAMEYWSEAVFNAELMTPRIEFRGSGSPSRPPGVIDNPLSALTIGAMQDLGYQVNYGAAQPYQLPNALGLLSAADPASLNQLVSDATDGPPLPAGTAYIYARPNILSEQSASYALAAGNTELISASGTSALFIEGATGENLLVELKGEFQKSDPATIEQLAGMVSSMEIYSQTGTLLLSIDYAQKPAQVAQVMAQWPNHSIDDDNVIVVDSLDGTVVRINPQGGAETDNRIFAGAGDDYVRGGGAAERIDGGADNDSLHGEGGNDTLIGDRGDDLIDGGGGTDMALYSGDQASYTLTLTPGGTTLEDRRADGNGTDILENVEFLDFDVDFLGVPFDLREFGGPAGLSDSDFKSFIELYIAYFNRAPDAVGLNFWGTAFANGTTLQQMAALFGPQEETLAAYPPGTSNEVFATTVYNNVLGRVPDQDGIDFWVGQLDAETVSRDQFILEVLQGAKSALKPELGQDFVDQQLADRTYLENKIDIGAYFAVHKGMSDVGNAAAAMALFDGSEGSITDAVSAIDGFHADALDPETGEFLMPLVGVLDDPFAMA